MQREKETKRRPGVVGAVMLAAMCANAGSGCFPSADDTGRVSTATDKCKDKYDECARWKGEGLDCDAPQKHPHYEQVLGVLDLAGTDANDTKLAAKAAKRLKKKCRASCGICDPGSSGGGSSGGGSSGGGSSKPSKCDRSSGSSAGKPNVVFILADDLGYGDLGSYGHPYAKTPTLDKLAKEGTRFERFYVTGVTCAPSRTGFMTSRHPASFKDYPAKHGYGDTTTVTEILSDACYATAHFGKWHMGKGKEDVPNVYGIHHVREMSSDKGNNNGRDFPIFKAAADWIGDHVKQNPNQAFYVNVSLHATHFPVIEQPSSLVAPFKNLICRRNDFLFNMQERFDACESVGGDIVSGMRNYMGDVHGIDIGAKHLLDAIDSLGLKQNTIVVFSSDQGPAAAGKKHGKESANMLGYSGGLRGGKHDQYDGGVRVPMIIRWPAKVPAGKVNKKSIWSALDWLPTLASIAGAKNTPSGIEGEDVADIWKGSGRSRRKPLFWKTSSPGSEATMLDGDWKLHVAKKGKRIELYDLSSDEKERNNVASKSSSVVTRLKQQLDSWVKTLPDSYNK